MKPIELKKGVYWVGGIDWDLRNFHGYLTQRGSTYNAYLIIDDKITLIDTVKHYLYEEMLARISAVVDPAKIDYIICNHVEMDHSGSIPLITKTAKNAKVLASPAGEKGLRHHYREELNIRAVKAGETILLGKRSLQFLLTPMVHWPDNMIAYCPEEKILFSNDAFGQHIATSERFDDEYHADVIIEEAKKYYANIVLPYSAQVKKALDAAATLDIGVIAPSHGIIWRSAIPNILRHYKAWSENTVENKALVIYDTMWNSTRKIAYAIREAFENRGVHTAMYDLKFNHISDIMTDVLTARYICVGSPTLNNNMLPGVAAFLTYLKGLAPRDRTGLAFGSFGWGGQSIELVHRELEGCGFKMLEKIRVQYIPDDDTLSGIAGKLESAL
ncbi:MAG TPA: FprA family A-type flavoprotein [Spirochaetota bacterium]|nr:FprA family A-type flavoprotein [Spirochaetota bacterium]